MPLLFPRREGVPMKLVWIILGSKFAQQHKFLKQYSSRMFLSRLKLQTMKQIGAKHDLSQNSFF